MTVGTEGNDQLTNDTSKVTETVSALGGDDVVTINSPRVISSSADIGVDGGSGYDILVASGLQFRAFANSGLDGSLAVRDSSLFNYFVSWTGIEELHLDGDLFQPGTYSLGGTVDILHLSTTFSGSYLLQTNGGNDQIYWQSSSSGTAITIDAGAGNDLIDFTGANLGTRIGQGGDGNDTLIGSGGADRLEGGNGDDVIDGKAGGDTMLGGTGNDLYYVDNAGDTVTENANEGTDEVRTTLAAYALTANVENLTGLVNSGQALTGNGLDNHITGGSGNDALTGGDGNDILDGGAGADAMAGGLGNDIYYVDDAGDTVTENPGEGTDEVRTGLASYTLGANVENLTGLAVGQTLTGNALANVITAAPGSAVLHGAGGDDVLKIAGSGQAFGDSGTDTLAADFSAATGSVTVSSSADATDGGSDLVITDGTLSVSGYSIEKLVLTAGSGNDSFSTTEGDDVVNPGSGTDSVSTLGGNDTIVIDASGAKSVQAGAGTDTLVIDYGNATQSVFANIGPNANAALGGWDGEYYNNTDNSHVDYNSVERFVITTGSGNDSIVTKDGDDVVTLNGGDDFVDVGTGGDTADGGTGVDGISANLLDTAGAVVWNLQTNSFSNPGGPDSFTNFEYFGSIITAGGNDVITTAAGGHNESITTAAGNDTVTVVDGADRANMGIGTDTLIVDYHSATQG